VFSKEKKLTKKPVTQTTICRISCKNQFAKSPTKSYFTCITLIQVVLATNKKANH